MQLNAVNSWVNVVGGSYSSNKAEVHPDRPTLRVANNATLNVTNADVTGTYCDVFVTGATANLFGGTYTNTNEYFNHEPINYESPALKVWNGGTLSVNGATVDCTGGNAAISSGEVKRCGMPCLRAKAWPVSLLREQTAVASKRNSSRAASRIQSVIKLVPIIPKRTFLIL